MTTQALAVNNQLFRAKRIGLFIGLFGAATAAFLWWVGNPSLFLHSYLAAFLFWAALAVGSLGLALIGNVVSSNWAEVARPYLTAAARTLPLMMVFFIPIALSLQTLYPWADGARVLHDEILEKRVAYLNSTFFLVRSCAYFMVFFVMQWALLPQKLGQAPTDAMRRKSTWALVIYGLVISFAGFDWVMSLNPHWYSNVFGVIYGVGQLLESMAFLIAMIIYLKMWVAYSELETQTLQDMASLLLVFVLFWTYVNFGQFLIIWSGQLPEEVAWYHERNQGGWSWISYGLLFLHFLFPFFLLLFRTIKRAPYKLFLVCCLLLVMRIVDIIWNVFPTYQNSLWISPWPFLSALIGLGGFWMILYLSQFRFEVLAPTRPHSGSAKEGHHE